MTSDTAREIAALAALLASRRTDNAGSEGWRVERAASDALELAKLATAIKRRGIHACNYGADDRSEKRRDRADERAYAQAAEICQPYGCTVAQMEDVRGYAMRLQFPSKDGNSPPSNGWGSGWGVASL